MGGGERRAGLRAAHLKSAFVPRGSRMFSVSLLNGAVSKAQPSYRRSERSGTVVRPATCKQDRPFNSAKSKPFSLFL